MGQIVGAIEGMKLACLALDFPVISGNVSLYNETSGVAILPTPAIGGVGLLEDLTKRTGMAIGEEGLHLLLVGETKGHLGQSLYLREILGKEEGAPPPVDLGMEYDNGNFIRKLIHSGRVSACHDISDGGLLVAIAEMCMARGIGATLSLPENTAQHTFAFAEDQARYILAVAAEHTAAIKEEAENSGIAVTFIGNSGGDKLEIEGQESVAVAELKTANENWLPDYMQGL